MSTPEWDSIMPEAERQAKRAKEVRDRIAQLREYKKQGRSYDGERVEEAKKKKSPMSQSLDDDAGFSQLMNEAESFFSSKDQTKQTSSVGGTWTPPPALDEEETHKPKVATWGRFPRPKDISKAYGGGKRIGVGAINVVNETAEAEKQRATTEALARFREKNGADRRLVEANRDKIENAIDTAQKLVLRGNGIDAVKILKPIVDSYCSIKTDLGANAMLELALCYEAVADTESAKLMYGQLVLSPISDIKRRAIQLSFGFEAQEKLNVGSYKDSEAAALAKSVWQFDLNDLGAPVYLTNTPTSKLSTAKKSSNNEQLSEQDEAFDVLRRATIGGEAFASPERVANALILYDTEFDDHIDNASVFEDHDVERKQLASKSTSADTSRTETIAHVQNEDFVSDEFTQEEQETGLDRVDGEWNVVMIFSRDDDPTTAKYAPRGTSINFDATSQTVYRKIPILGGNFFFDWFGRAEAEVQRSSSIVAYLNEVQPALFSPLANAEWRVKIMHLDKRILALRADNHQLFLCKRQK